MAEPPNATVASSDMPGSATPDGRSRGKPGGDGWAGVGTWIAAALAALGVLLYGSLRIAYEVFYSHLRVEPEDVGLDYQRVLSQSVGGVLLLATVAALGAGLILLASKRWGRQVITWVTLVAIYAALLPIFGVVVLGNRDPEQADRLGVIAIPLAVIATASVAALAWSRLSARRELEWGERLGTPAWSLALASGASSRWRGRSF